MKSQKPCNPLENLIGTDRVRQADLETFTEEMQRMRHVLGAASTLLQHYGHPEDRFSSDKEILEVPKLSAVIGQLLEDQIEILVILEEKGVELSKAPATVIPPATVKFARAPKAAASAAPAARTGG